METQVADSPPVSDFRSRLRALSSWTRTSVAFVATLAAVSIFVALLGANPVDVFDAIIRGSLGNSFNISQTVTVMSILILTGLAAAIPFSARLWNIGGEGQMTAGAVAAATLGIVLPEDLPRLLFPLIALAGAAIGCRQCHPSPHLGAGGCGCVHRPGMRSGGLGIRCAHATRSTVGR